MPQHEATPLPFCAGPSPGGAELGEPPRVSTAQSGVARLGAALPCLSCAPHEGASHRGAVVLGAAGWLAEVQPAATAPSAGPAGRGVVW